MILAFVLGLLTISGLINVWEIMILAFLLGSITAIDLPARQAFTFEMVDKKDLPSAIALNSAIFNGSRVIGPGIAGLVIASIGTGGTFILNGISYIASIAGLFFIKVNFIESKDHPHPLKAIKDGISYSWNSRLIKTILIFSAVISVFGFSYLTIMPVIAKNIFHIEASGLGYLFSASGLGALAGTILLSAFSRKIKSPVLIFGGISLFSLSIMIFTFITSFPLALVFMFFSGIGMMACFSTINTFLQENIENKFRGRVMSIYTLVFMGLAPLGNIQIGYFSEHFGTSFAIQLGIAIVILSSAIIFLNKKTKNALFARPKSSY
jgi:MFS family permease